MWNKKKTKKLNIQEQSGIKYTGNVIVQKLKRGKIVDEFKQHNAWTSFLFEFLLKCLQGNYVSGLRPYWIVPCMKVESEEETYYTYVSSSIRPIMSTKISSLSVTNSYIEYKFYLPYRPEYLSQGFDTVIIYNSSNKPEEFYHGEPIQENYSMIVNFSEGDTRKIIKANEDEDILITWQLNLRN